MRPLSVFLCWLAILPPMAWPQTILQQDYDIRTYNFTRMNGVGASGDLSAAGTGKVITLTPCPKGLAVGSKVYISGGTGTAEAAAITATSCPVYGASTGTITVTTTYSHVGAWIARSATGGIQEAQQAIANSSLAMGAGTVYIPGQNWVTLYAAVTAIANTKIRFRGDGSEATVILRGGNTFHLFYNALSTAQWTFEDLGINQQSGYTAGAAIYLSGATSHHIYRCEIFNGQFGIYASGTTFLDIDGTKYTNTDLSTTAVAGLTLTGMGHNAVVRNSVFGGLYDGTHGLQYGVNVSNWDGGWFVNSGGAGNVGINVTSSTGNFTTNIHFYGCFSDSSYTNSYSVSAGTGTVVGNIRWVGGHLHNQGNNGGGAGNSATVVIQAGTNPLKDIAIQDAPIGGSLVQGVYVTAGATDGGCILSGNTISSNNRSAGGAAAIQFTAGATGWTVVNNTVSSDGDGTVAYAFYTDGTFDGIVSTNDFSDASSAISLGGVFTGTLTNNKGVPLGAVSATGGAATMNWPAGTVTSESLTTAAGATYTLTVTNSFVSATSLVTASVCLGSATQGTPQVVTITPGSGSVVIVVKNIDGTKAFDGTIKVSLNVQNGN